MDPTVLAIPAFVLLMAAEITAYLVRPDTRMRGYTVRDTATSLSMGIGSLVVGIGWAALTLLLWRACYDVTPLRVPNAWWSWVLAMSAVDFFYYWEHRAGHEIRVLWASHVVHHSSRHYNLSTALRQTWTGAHHMVFLAPVALLGFRVETVATAFAFNLLYQFWIHTERVRTMWRPFEFVFNTPSHHRVHHGINPQYLDRNYGGILIVFDRLFGTFEPEGEPAVYGITKDVGTFNPLRVAFHEYGAIWRDVRAAATWSERAGRVFRGPGWSPVAEVSSAPAAEAAA